MIDLEKYEKANAQMDDVHKEIKIMSRMHHPNVLSYYASFTHEKELWLVMPLVQMGSIKSLI